MEYARQIWFENAGLFILERTFNRFQSFEREFKRSDIWALKETYFTYLCVSFMDSHSLLSSAVGKWWKIDVG